MKYKRKRHVSRQTNYRSKQVKKRTAGIHNYINKLKNLPTALKTNPLGLGMANYCGPGTKLVGQKPTSKSDEVCMSHDYDYEDVQKKYKQGIYSKEEAIKKTRQADEKMLSSLKTISEDNLIDKVVHTGSQLGIKFKNILEDLNILDPLKFSVD